MDDHYVYVFVRQDLPIPTQLVHVCHATYHMTRLHRPDEGIPCLVVIGCPNPKAIGRVRAKMEDRQLPHFCWDDPDDQDGLLAIATAPLNDEQRSHLMNYRLYSFGPAQAACNLTVDEGASLCQEGPS